jgi:hypothetical protein
MQKIETIGGNWEHLQIIQKILEKRRREARNQGTKENSYTGQCVRTSGNVKVQSV